MRGRIAAICALLAFLTGCGGAPAPGVGGNRGGVAVDGAPPGGEAQGGGSGTDGTSSFPGSGDVLARYGGPTELLEPAPHEPRDLAIPKLEVRSGLLRLGLNPDESLEVPGDFDLAGWYVHAPPPGEMGPAVIAGHVDSRRGPAIFSRLGELVPGDEIFVRRGDGAVLAFVVERVEQHAKNEFPTESVYGNTDRPELRLITCGGTFDRSQRHYRDNVIVFAVLRGFESSPAPTNSPSPTTAPSGTESPSAQSTDEGAEPNQGGTESPGADAEAPEPDPDGTPGTPSPEATPTRPRPWDGSSS